MRSGSFNQAAPPPSHTTFLTGQPKLISTKSAPCSCTILAASFSFTGEHFWARGYYVSTVGLDEEVVRQYIQNQEDEDRRVDQLRLLD